MVFCSTTCLALQILLPKKFAFCRFWLNTSNFQLRYVSTVFDSWVCEHIGYLLLTVTWIYCFHLFPSSPVAWACDCSSPLLWCWMEQTLDNLHMSLNVQIPTTMASLSLSLIKRWITYSSFIIRKQFAIAWLRSLNFKLLNCEVISYIYI